MKHTQTPQEDTDLVRRVDLALGELRRGRIVLLRDSSNSYACLASELISDGAIARLRQLGCDEPVVALTASRAAVLHIPPTGDDVVCLPIDAHMDASSIQALADPTQDLANPMRGPLQRSKNPLDPAIQAAIKLCKLAQLLPSISAVKIENASAHSDSLAWVEVEDPDRYDLAAAITLQRVSSARVPLGGAEDARIIGFRAADGGLEHYAIVIGEPSADEPVLTRLHSECFTGDLLGSLRCDCGQQLRGAIEEIGKAGQGVLLYLAQEGRGIGLMNKLRAYELQDDGFDTIEANERLGFEPDERIFAQAAHMLRQLGFRSVRLMTNNPDKVEGLGEFEIDVVERVPHQFPSNAHNELYLATKAKRSGHYLSGYSSKHKKAGRDH